jgi:hypothetical protein
MVETSVDSIPIFLDSIPIFLRDMKTIEILAHGFLYS